MKGAKIFKHRDEYAAFVYTGFLTLKVLFHVLFSGLPAAYNYRTTIKPFAPCC